VPPHDGAVNQNSRLKGVIASGTNVIKEYAKDLLRRTVDFGNIHWLMQFDLKF
jgi:negative regulator of replication initiation